MHSLTYRKKWPYLVFLSQFITYLVPIFHNAPRYVIESGTLLNVIPLLVHHFMVHNLFYIICRQLNKHKIKTKKKSYEQVSIDKLIIAMHGVFTEKNFNCFMIIRLKNCFNDDILCVIYDNSSAFCIFSLHIFELA